MNTEMIASAERLLKHFGIPGAIVAGGAIRDAVMDRQVKDFDLYVLDSEAVHAAMLRAFPHARPFEREGDDTGYPTDDADFEVWEAGEFEGKDVQIMTLASMDPEEYLTEAFDFGLCRAFLSIEAGLVLQPEFITDVVNQTITYYPSEHNWYSAERVQRLLAKYPGYTVRGKV